ncbi:hypothetical protein BOTBODRAFT_265601 [Botryobasidium botryosum FD-172 SS1]|uniref:Uncharacterized protein n=1 Tax=Botryobasidium botryosum (strain FD-172 SS1) TaxID=930990 RepID=A0A067MKC9_BOTB1|nr:hypothetical protein BOTBODRAFT_265601 [Botryobasidium botryosum FD-172 SS1]
MSTYTSSFSAYSAPAHQPASSTASPIAASSLFLFKLLFSFSFTSIRWLVVFIRWILCSFFTVFCAAFFNGDSVKAAALQAPISFPRVNEAPVLVKIATTAPRAANITHQARSPASIRCDQAPIYAPSSCFAPLASSIAPRYSISLALRTVDADKARRGPVVPAARSRSSAPRTLGEVELPLRERQMAELKRRARVKDEARAQEEARAKEEGTAQEYSRQAPVAVNGPAIAQDIDHAPAAIRAPPYAEVTRPSPVLVQPSAAINSAAEADVSVTASHSPALSAAPPALCPVVLEPYSVATDHMECDERPVALEPLPMSVDDVLMDVDSSTSPEECMDTPSLLSPSPSPSPSSMPPITPPAVFPRGDFFDVMVTSCEDDDLVNSLRACTLSCLHPMLPPMDVEPDAPVAEVTLSLSECSLADAAVLAEMDVDEDVMVVCGDDQSSPVFLAMDIDDADQEDTQIIYSDDNSRAAPSSFSGMLPSIRSRSRLVKRHKRQCARVDIPSDFSAAPTPQPKLFVLRLVEKYADLGLDRPGVVFRVKLDVGVRKIEKDSRSA